MSEPTYGKTPEGQEPDLVKGMSAQMSGQQNGQADAMIQATKIYADFKWSLKKKDHTYEEIAKELDICILRCETEMKATTVRAEAIKRFKLLKQRVEQFIVQPEGEQICAKCQLAKFICPCPKE